MSGRGRQKYRLDQDCRVKAIELASRLFPAGEKVMLSINFMPNAVYEPAACLRATLLAALRCSFLAEGIETEAEFLVLREAGIRLFQGYWFAKPAFEELPVVRSGLISGAATVA